jgi:hypothetical protein
MGYHCEGTMSQVGQSQTFCDRTGELLYSDTASHQILYGGSEVTHKSVTVTHNQSQPILSERFEWWVGQSSTLCHPHKRGELLAERQEIPLLFNLSSEGLSIIDGFLGQRPFVLFKGSKSPQMGLLEMEPIVVGFLWRLTNENCRSH